jgi:hypothetical protein
MESCLLPVSRIGARVLDGCLHVAALRVFWIGVFGRDPPSRESFFVDLGPLGACIGSDSGGLVGCDSPCRASDPFGNGLRVAIVFDRRSTPCF